MGNCKFSYTKKEVITKREYLYCSKNDKICPYVRFCNDLNKIVNVNNYKICKDFNIMDIPLGKNKVRFIKNEKLIVELYDKTGNVLSCVEVDNPFNKFIKYVELIELNGIYYVKGYEPKVSIKKKRGVIE
ncbi:MAG: hypothetical protein RR255_00290 [Bacilli bacterium]